MEASQRIPGMDVKKSSADADDDGRRFHAMKPWIVLFLCGWTVVSCRSTVSTELPAALLFQDYYFNGNSTQIQGRASLGPARLPLDNTPGRTGNNAVEKNPATSERKAAYLTLEERRMDCQKRAVQNAATKFVSLTMADRQDQAEWDLRLKLGARGSWYSCLADAHVLGAFFDEPGICRVVIRYPCLPQKY